MTFYELAQSRYSVRSYSDKPVEEEKLNKILEAGRIAPTAKNLQPQKIYILKGEKAKLMHEQCPSEYGAPVCLLIGFDKNIVSTRPNGYNFGEIDSTIVGTHMMLQAAELGLGTCWVGAFDKDLTRKTFNIPENIIICSVMPIGYPAEDAAPSPRHGDRRPLSETVTEL